MKRISKLLLSVGLFSTLGLSMGAQAQSSFVGGAGAIAGAHDALEQVIGSDLDKVTQFTLNRIVREGNGLLAEHGFVQDAQNFQKDWDNNYSGYFTSTQLFDLGDHQPLNAWLADYYKKLEDKLGDPILRLVHIDDINVLNYAIPIVFQPKGDKRNGDHWDDAEYSNHFVPFVSVVAYWAGYVGCRSATGSHPAFKRYCGIAAGALKTLVKSTVGPKLSKVVYARGVGQKPGGSVNLTSYDQEANRRVQAIPLN